MASPTELPRHVGFRSLPRDRRGMMSIIHIVVVLLTTLLIVTLYHIACVVDHRTTQQDAADAMAISAATWQARSLNSLTAVNHAMGEITALVVLHDALGGPDPGSDKQESTLEDTQLDLAWTMATAMGAPAPAYGTVSLPVMSAQTIGEAQLELKSELAETYVALAAALAAENIPLIAFNSQQELQILAEYQLTLQLEQLAIGTRGLRKHLERQALPECKAHADRIVRDAPHAIREAAFEVARLYGVEGHLSGRLLPVAPDPLAMAENLDAIPEQWYAPASRAEVLCPLGVASWGRDDIVKRTQLARATFPWVNFHRTPLVETFETLFQIVDVAAIYLERTTAQTVDLCDHLQRNGHLWLWVLDNTPLVNKGHECWADEPRLADRQFAIVAIAKAGPQGGLSRFALPQSHLRVTYAQAMAYNANRQQPYEQRIDLKCSNFHPIRQAVAGWDTLNWHMPHAKGPYEVTADHAALDPHEQPVVRVNWQAKLVPGSASQLAEVARDESLPDELRAHFSRLPSPLPLSLLTH